MDIYESVTQRIITALEQGTPPWVKPGIRISWLISSRRVKRQDKILIGRSGWYRYISSD